MSDLVERLRAAASYALMDGARATVCEAADEIERLRSNSSVGVSATGAESGSTPDAQGFGRSNESPCQPFDSAPTTDQERFVRFQSAVMNWISEATGFLHDDVLRTDDARDVITNACMRCWDAFDRISYPSTNHDAAPAARANAESVAPQPTADDRSGNPTSHSGTGKQPAPPCVETDGFSSGSSSDPINRNAERESPRRECGESSLRDVPQLDNSRAAGGPEHHISEAQIDALECVVEDGRIVGMSVYGHLRSLLVKLRPEWEEESDRPKPVKDDDSDRSKPVAPAVTVGGVDRPVSYAETDQNRIFYDTKRDTTQPQNGALSGCETVPDPDSRVWETPRTPQPHATPPQGSVKGEGSFRDSRNAKEPVAWAVMERDGFGIEATFDDHGEACEWCDNRQQIVPLYRHPQPTLTDEEREAIEDGIRCCDYMAAYKPMESRADLASSAATLRGLLKRAGSP